MIASLFLAATLTATPAQEAADALARYALAAGLCQRHYSENLLVLDELPPEIRSELSKFYLTGIKEPKRLEITKPVCEQFLSEALHRLSVAVDAWTEK